MLSIHVAIADDDDYICQKIREYLMIYSTREDVEMAPPDIYHDCESLFQAYLDGSHYDILFLDIDFSTDGKRPNFSKKPSMRKSERMNGVSLGSCLRNAFGIDDVDIIYTTAFAEYAIDAIHARPAAFIQKPITLEKLTLALKEVMHAREISNRYFEFTYNKVPTRIQVSRIQYLNSCGRQIIVRMVDDCFAFYGKLSEIMQQKCFRSFICIHKSYLVNPNYIERFTAGAVYMHGNSHEMLPISRTQQPHVDEWLLRG